jgi:hypothetical protein
MKEKIVKAAVKVGDKVYVGWHHRDIFDEIWETERLGIDEIKQEMQGFVTNTGKFVNRIEAANIAFKAGQIKSGTNSLDSYQLF